MAGLLYGYGWIILFQFYGHFGVSPEDVGVTFTFVTVRIAFLVTVLFGLAALAALALRPLSTVRIFFRDRRPGADDSGPSDTGDQEAAGFGPLFWLIWVFGSWLGTLFVLGFVLGLLQSMGLVEEEGKHYEAITTWIGYVALAAPVWLALLIFGYLFLTEWLTGRVVSLRALARALSVGLWVLVGASLIVAAWWVPRRLVQTVEQGVQATSIPAVSALGLPADTVLVSSTDGSALSPHLESEHCLWAFGTAHGMTVLYEPEQELVVRVPTERLVIERPCS